MKNSLLIIFIISSLSLCGQRSNDVTFKKSQKTYRAKSIKYTYPNFFTGNEFKNRYYYPSKITEEEAHEFPIIFTKKAIKVGNIELFPIIFGKRAAESYGITIDNKYYEWGKRLDYLSFSGDSIFYNDYSYDENNLVRKLFCVLDENWKETLFIKSFGEMYYHKIWYLNSFFYTPINDTVYNFKLKYAPILEESSYQDGMEKTATCDFFSTFNILNIGISKKYGFVWIKYKFRENEYEIYYY